MNAIKNCRHGLMAYNTNDLFVGKSLQEYGEFSEGESELFKKVVATDDIVLDVGANIGTHSIFLSQLVGSKGAVLAFEPQRLVYYLLCTNVSLNSLVNVVCLQNAVGKEAGRIIVPDLDSKQETNFGGVEMGELGDTEHKGFSVRVVTIDSFNIPKLSLIKIDVEGMESDVLEGAKETILRCRPILYIENDRHEKAIKLVSDIKRLGYEVYLHAPKLYNEHNFAGNLKNIFHNTVSINMFCHPSEVECPINPTDFGMCQMGKDNSFEVKLVTQEQHQENLESLKNRIVGDLLQMAKIHATGTFQIDEALNCLQRAMAFSGGDPLIIQNSFPTLITNRRYEDGLKLADYCQEKGLPSALFYRGFFLGALNRLEEAVESYRKYIQANPDNKESHVAMSMDLLRLGQYKEGFSWYEYRLQSKSPNYEIFRSKLPKGMTEWNKSWLQNKRILIYNEQGAGDMIQFCRYLPILKAKGAYTILACPQSLMWLMSQLPEIDEILPIDEFGYMEDCQADYCCSVLSLPYHFWTDYDKAPNAYEVPYFHPGLAFSPELAEIKAIKIGICWAGNERHESDSFRSCPLKHFEHLLELPNITLVSLQKGPMKRRWPYGPVNLTKDCEDFPLFDVMDKVQDYQDTANLIGQLDYVVTVDTSIAHLAGAMGKKVFLMIPNYSCWRWVYGEKESHWYPTMKIFQGDDWQESMRAIAESLKEEMK